MDVALFSRQTTCSIRSPREIVVQYVSLIIIPILVAPRMKVCHELNVSSHHPRFSGANLFFVSIDTKFFVARRIWHPSLHLSNHSPLEDLFDLLSVSLCRTTSIHEFGSIKLSKRNI